VQEAIKMYTIVNLVAANLGISIVSSSVSTFRRSGGVFRPFLESVPPAPLYTVWRTDVNQPVLSAFIKTVKEVSPVANLLRK